MSETVADHAIYDLSPGPARAVEGVLSVRVGRASAAGRDEGQRGWG
jgi:hypothetical protein